MSALCQKRMFRYTQKPGARPDLNFVVETFCRIIYLWIDFGDLRALDTALSSHDFFDQRQIKPHPLGWTLVIFLTSICSRARSPFRSKTKP